MVHEALLIEENEAGRVIGKKGVKINEFKAKYGVQIKVQQECKDGNGMIPIHIFCYPDSGSGPEQMKECKEDIIAHLNAFTDAYSGSREAGGDPNDPAPPKHNSGFGGGSGFESSSDKTSAFNSGSGFGAQTNSGSASQNGFRSNGRTGSGSGGERDSAFNSQSLANSGDSRAINCGDSRAATSQPAGRIVYKPLGGFGRGKPLPNVTTVLTAFTSSVRTETSSLNKDPRDTGMTQGGFNSGTGFTSGGGTGFSSGGGTGFSSGGGTGFSSGGGTGFSSGGGSGFSSGGGTGFSSGGGSGFSSGGGTGFNSNGRSSYGRVAPTDGGNGFNSAPKFNNGFQSSNDMNCNSGFQSRGGFSRVHDSEQGGFSQRGDKDFATLLAEVDIKATEKWSNLPPIVKNHYKEHTEIRQLTDSDVIEVRNIMKDVRVQDMRKGGESRPVPRITFTFNHSLHPFPELMTEVDRNGFKEPSPIQAQLWPILFSGFDAIGIAQTGTGKTLSFLFPAFVHIDRQTVNRCDRKGPTVLVLTPTRELAQQIECEVRKYNYKNIKSVCLYGGGSRSAQVSTIREGIEIVIATPGRLNDLIMNGFVSLECISYVVLDEADRMLDMGFEMQISGVLMGIRPDRQTVMTSATWPESVRRLSDKYMNDPFLVSVGSLDIKACLSVAQAIHVMENEDKLDLLKKILVARKAEDKFLIFCARKATVTDLASTLVQKEGMNVETMHGDMDQSDRERALRHLKNGKTKIVVATDVAARGLDILDITYVINHDMTNSIDEYVHRIGRTGRAGKTGNAITFVTKYDWAIAEKLVAVLEEAGQIVPERLRGMAYRWATKAAQRVPGGQGERPTNQRRARSPQGFYDPVTGERIGTRT